MAMNSENEADLRFVLLEIGKLSSNVERLITDVKSMGEKVDGSFTQYYLHPRLPPSSSAA